MRAESHRRGGDRLDDELARRVADTMQALATPSRLHILRRLDRGPCDVATLAAEVGMEGSAVSHQLRLLRHLGLVSGRREGRHVVYSLHDHHVGQLLGEAIAHAEHLNPGPTGARAPEVETVTA